MKVLVMNIASAHPETQKIVATILKANPKLRAFLSQSEICRAALPSLVSILAFNADTQLLGRCVETMFSERFRAGLSDFPEDLGRQIDRVSVQFAEQHDLMTDIIDKSMLGHEWTVNLHLDLFAECMEKGTLKKLIVDAVTQVMGTGPVIEASHTAALNMPQPR